MGLLDEPRYRAFLADTHPHLGIDDGRLGGIPSFLAPLDVREPLAPGPMRKAAYAARPLLPSVITPPALFIGTPFEPYDQTSLAAQCDPNELSAKIRDTAEGCAVAVITNVRPAELDLARWSDAGWVALPSFPDTTIDLSVDSFEAHLLRLPAGDRSGMRRNCRRFERAGHRIERVSDSGPLAEALFDCYLPFFERAAVRWQAHTRAYFGGLTALGPGVHLAVARSASGRIIGFVVGFEDERGLQAGRIGVHPDFHRKDAVYFRLIYHVIEAALTRFGGTPSRLSMEPTGYRLKRHLGAERVRMVNLVLGLDATWRFLLDHFDGLGQRLLGHLQRPAALERLY